MTRTLYSPALDAASALLWSKEVVLVRELPASQNGAKQKAMIGKECIVKKRRDEWVCVAYGATSAWVHESMVEPVVIP